MGVVGTSGGLVEYLGLSGAQTGCYILSIASDASLIRFRAILQVLVQSMRPEDGKGFRHW